MKALPLLIAVLLPAHVSSAAFTLLSNFDNLNLGTLAGQSGWSLAASPNSNTSTVIADPTNSSNQVAQISDSGTGNQANTIYLPLGSSSIVDGSTSTLFFRFYTTSATIDFNMGLTDVATPNDTNAYAPNQTQFRVGGSSGQLDTRDGSGFQSLTSFDTSTWYNMWIVVDNDANTQTFFRSTGTDDGTLIGSADYTFRTSTTNTIQTLALIANNPSNTILIDDIYMASGVNTTYIPEPTTALLGGLGLLALLRRRR